MKLINTEGIQLMDDGTFDSVRVLREYYMDGGAGDDFREEALYLCDLSDICWKMRNWMLQMPRVHPFYAVKCNDDMMVIRVLAALGAGFDCASQAEIQKVLSVGVIPDKIIYANPCKLVSHIKYAAQESVSVMTFDSIIELHKVKKLYPDAKMVLRFRCDANSEVVKIPIGNKFACDPDDEARRLLQEAKTLEMDVIGVSFHVGSGCIDPPIFRKAISIARELFDYGTLLGFNMELLDVGGGFLGEKGTSISEIAQVVNCSLDKYFPQPEVRVISEPGRYFVASAFTLATTIHSKTELLDTEGNVEHVKYYINDGVYGSFNCVISWSIFPSFKVLNKGETTGALQNASLWGPTCAPTDKIHSDLQLPSLTIGDVIYFENMGAYTITLASSFNGYSPPDIRHFIDQADWNSVANFFKTK